VAPRPKSGLSKSARARFAEGLNYYTGQYAIDEERSRQKANDERFKSTEQEFIKWDPNTTYSHGPSQSSRVKSFRFVAMDGIPGAVGFIGTLFVEFWPKKEGSAGARYKYMNVPENVFQAFANTQSKGRYINAVLNNFNYSPVTGGEDIFFKG
jgi:hypothetical protein